jgi:hypothetical protein
MLLWWFTFSFACEPVSKLIARVMLCVILAEVKPNITTPAPLITSPSTSTLSPKTSELIPGIYDYESSVNFDNYLAELGVNYVLRKLAGLAYPTVTISKQCQDIDNIQVITFLLKISLLQNTGCPVKI